MADKPAVFNPITDLKAIVTLLTLAWVVWFINGGPAKYEQSQRPFLKEPTEMSSEGIWADPFISEQYGSISDFKITREGSTTTNQKKAGSKGSVVEVSVKSTSTSKIINNKTNSGSLFEKPVIYLAKGRADVSGMSYLKIDFPIFNKATLKITGLSVRNLFGRSTIIQGASDLPYQGLVNEENDVLVPPGSTIYLIERPSPIGVSFRANKCIGLLAEFQKFYPTLPRSEYEGQVSSDFTYNDCVAVHGLDPDFYHKEWHIYLKTEGKVWTETGGLIRLIDESGQTLTSLFY